MMWWRGCPHHGGVRNVFYTPDPCYKILLFSDPVGFKPSPCSKDQWWVSCLFLGQVPAKGKGKLYLVDLGQEWKEGMSKTFNYSAICGFWRAQVGFLMLGIGKLFKITCSSEVFRFLLIISWYISAISFLLYWWCHPWSEASSCHFLYIMWFDSEYSIRHAISSMYVPVWSFVW